MSENKVRAKVYQILEKHGAYYIDHKKLDIIICYKGQFLAVECKAGYNKPTPLQEREMMAIHKAGGSAIVIREDTTELLDVWFSSKG